MNGQYCIWLYKRVYIKEWLCKVFEMDNKNAISWFIFGFETEELYKCKYNKVLGKLWGKYEGFRVKVTQWDM